MGLGLFGGGASVVRFLIGRGASVLVTDLRDEADLAPTLEDLGELTFDRAFGSHRHNDFSEADYVVVNPAIPDTSPYLASAIEGGASLTSEVGLCLSRMRSRLVLVTGSKGKSTTSALIHSMLVAEGVPATLGGNIGYPLLSQVDTLGDSEVVVFEISSFQLEQIRGLDRSPEVSVVTNLFPVHLDRHGTFESYIDAKREVLSGAGCAVFGNEGSEVMSLAETFPGPVRVCADGEQAPPSGVAIRGSMIVDDRGGTALDATTTPLPGEHNSRNIALAWMAAEKLGVSKESAQRAIDHFEGLPHRLQLLLESDGLRWVNDSIATAPPSAIAAIKAIPGPLILIAGGKETGAELENLAAAIVARVRLLIVTGESAERLKEAVTEAGGQTRILTATGLEEAVSLAREEAQAGDAILLSPAFPSYDCFRNFVERGEMFRTLAIRDLRP